MEEGAPPDLKHFQISCSLVFSTPNPTTQNPICGNRQENEPNNNSVYEESLSSMSFQTLLAPAGAGGDQVAKGDALTTLLALAGAGDDQLAKGNALTTLLALAGAGGDQMAKGNALTALLALAGAGNDQVAKGVSSVPSMPFDINSPPRTMITDADFSNDIPFPCMPFDINSPPRTMIPDADFSNNIPFLFEPIKPRKSNKGEYQKESITGKDAEKNNTTGDRVMEPHGNKEKLHQIIDQSSAATSAQLQENHKPDKGGTEEVDFIKIPQQKARRKKHRPKVIIEGVSSVPCMPLDINSPPRTMITDADFSNNIPFLFEPIKPRKSNKGEYQQEYLKTTRVKRRYVRRKGVSNPSVKEINGIGLNNKEVSSTDTPTDKSKYTRRKGANKPGVDLEKETPKTTDVVAPRHTGSSYKRSLNFNSDGQVGDESSSHCMNQLQEDNSTNMDPLKDNTMLGGDQTLQTKGKCQVVFSNVTHSKETNTVQVRTNPDSQMMPKSLGNSICSSACLTPERQVRDLKRQNMGTDAESEICNRNESGTLYNFMQAYLPIFLQNVDRNNGSPGFHFPTIYKKKRTRREIIW